MLRTSINDVFEQNGTEKRRSRRLKSFLPTTLLSENVIVRVHVLDISTNGSLLHLRNAEVGAVVELRLNAKNHKATVAWARNNRVGLQFHKEIDQIELYSALFLT
ncbi:PilZ domain-containing protein [Sphingomonas sp. RS2018]